MMKCFCDIPYDNYQLYVAIGYLKCVSAANELNFKPYLILINLNSSNQICSGYHNGQCRYKVHLTLSSAR